MNTLQRYMVLNSLVLVVIPVMGQQKEEKEIKLNEETVKLIQFDFLPGDMENYNKPLEAPLEKKWMEFQNPFDKGIPRSLTDSLMAKKPKGRQTGVWQRNRRDIAARVLIHSGQNGEKLRCMM